jgi:hypothetical protein
VLTLFISTSKIIFMVSLGFIATVFICNISSNNILFHMWYINLKLFHFQLSIFLIFVSLVIYFSFVYTIHQKYIAFFVFVCYMLDKKIRKNLTSFIFTFFKNICKYFIYFFLYKSRFLCRFFGNEFLKFHLSENEVTWC